MSIILVLTFGLIFCLAQFSEAAPMGTAFTYQGRLIDNNIAADGEYDFQFRLFDGDTGGNQVGGDVSIGDVNVIDGYFTVELDFGSVFTTEARWLEIGVREGSSSGNFTTLSPRQKITAVPYAIKAEGLDGGNAVVRGHLQGTCVPPPPYPQPSDPLPAYPFEFDISQLGNISPSDVNVIVSGYKFAMPFASEGPLVIRWQVTDSPYDLTLLLEVYDENGNVYDTSDTTNWRDKKLSIDFIASGGSADSSVAFFSGSKIVGGRISGTPPATYPFEFDISELGDSHASDVMVVASGSKLTGTGEPETPLMVKWEVSDSPLTVAFRVWDTEGNEYSPASGSWLGRQVEMSFVAFDPNGGGVLSGGSQVVVSGGLEGICHDPIDAGAPDDTLPDHPFEFDISGLGAVESDDIAVCITGFKMSGSGVTEGPLWFDWEVIASPFPLTLRVNVWDENHNPYDFTDGINWEDKRLKLSYIASVNSGGMSAGGNVLSGKFEYTVNDYPTMPFEIPIGGFDIVDVNSINVVASGIRHETGGKAMPLAVKGAVVDSSGLKLNLWVWDINGDEPDDNNPAWDGKTLEVSYSIIGPAGGGSTGTAGANKVVTDLNLDSDGNIVTGALPQEDYYGTVTRVYLRDLPNLKARLGGGGITLTAVNDRIKKIMLSAQTYLEETQATFIGFRWARVNGGAIGTDETDIYWPVKVYEDEHTATEDTSATYKLMRVEAHLK